MSSGHDFAAALACLLGQLAAIFVVVQGLNFDLHRPCVTIVASRRCSSGLQIAFNPINGWSRPMPRPCWR